MMAIKNPKCTIHLVCGSVEQVIGKTFDRAFNDSGNADVFFVCQFTEQITVVKGITPAYAQFIAAIQVRGDKSGCL